MSFFIEMGNLPFELDTLATGIIRLLMRAGSESRNLNVKMTLYRSAKMTPPAPPPPPFYPDPRLVPQDSFGDA